MYYFSAIKENCVLNNILNSHELRNNKANIISQRFVRDGVLGTVLINDYS